MIIPAADRLFKVSEYYFSKKLKEIKWLQNSGKDIINLGIGSPDLPPVESVILELSETAQGSHNHGYQSYTGIPALRLAIADWLNERYATPFDDSEILPLIGSKEGIIHISMAFVNYGDLILVPNPGYPTYRSVAHLVQGKPLEYRLNENDNWLIDFHHLQTLPLDKVKLMWVNYPNMPTGAKGSTEQFERLIELAQKHEFLLINDNPYSQLFEGGGQSIFQIEGARKVCIELNSLSKSHNMAGWRIGWAAGDQQYIQNILKVKSNMDSGMFLGIQKAAIAALRSPESWYNTLIKTYKERRGIGFRILELLNCTFDKNQGGMFVWGKVPESIPDVESFIDTLINQAGVFFTPGFIFGSKGQRYIRISLCAPEEILEKAESRVLQFLKDNSINTHV